MGGRGTGKTTALKSMSYQGQFELIGQDSKRFAQMRYAGLYLRVNTNRVTAFAGPDQTEDHWRRAFAHYTNLLIVQSIVEMLAWWNSLAPEDTLAPGECSRICSSLGIPKVETLHSLSVAIENSISDLELYVNNLDLPHPTFSMLQAPIDVAVSAARTVACFHQKIFYIMLDEFENFLEYQQATVNTLIKHSSGDYVFKVGVKELGWVVRSTLNGREQLISPADYELINIEQKLDGNFPAFSRSVCETRLAQWAAATGRPPVSLTELLPELDYEEEATLLGVSDRVSPLRSQIANQEPDAERLLAAKDLTLFTFWILGRESYDSLVKSLRAYADGGSHEENQLNNYRYAALFAIAPTGTEVTKYYCGNRVFALIARSNIRFYLHLISQCLDRHVRSQRPAHDRSVSPLDQTLAARSVGLQYLTELEGVTVHGAQLVKLVLGFGRLFQLLARNPVGAAPECVEFQIGAKSDSTPQVGEATRRLLREAVMHLALVRSAGTKLVAESDIREWDYSVHPIFAPFFNFSHRKKRKLEVVEADILNMVSNPQATIRKLLRDRPHLADQEAPVQLKLFDEYFFTKHDALLSG